MTQLRILTYPRLALRTFGSPDIYETSGTQVTREGCLSMPGKQVELERAERILVRYQDEGGDVCHLEATGLLAVAIQHEIDHLDGVLMVDRWFKESPE